MTEFEKAQLRYEKRYSNKPAKVVPIKEPEPKKPDSISVTIVDGGKEHSFHFEMEGISGTRLAGQRNSRAYQQLLEDLIKKEFGRWRSLQTP